MKSHITLTIDNDVLNYARQYIPPREISQTVEDLLLKFADDQSGIKKKRDEQEKYFVDVIIPKLREFCKGINPNSKRIYNVWDLIDEPRQFIFVMKNLGIIISPEEVKQCVEICMMQDEKRRDDELY